MTRDMCLGKENVLEEKNTRLTASGWIVAIGSLLVSSLAIAEDPVRSGAHAARLVEGGDPITGLVDSGEPVETLTDGPEPGEIMLTDGGEPVPALVDSPDPVLVVCRWLLDRLSGA